MAIVSSVGEEPSPISIKCSSDWETDIVFVEDVGVYMTSGTFVPSVETALSK